MTMANINLEKQYHLTRAALISAGLDMNGSIDALYRDWRRYGNSADLDGATFFEPAEPLRL
jgi:hypothetical protein